MTLDSYALMSTLERLYPPTICTPYCVEINEVNDDEVLANSI